MKSSPKGPETGILGWKSAAVGMNERSTTTQTVQGSPRR